MKWDTRVAYSIDCDSRYVQYSRRSIENIIDFYQQQRQQQTLKQFNVEHVLNSDRIGPNLLLFFRDQSDLGHLLRPLNTGSIESRNVTSLASLHNYLV